MISIKYIRERTFSSVLPLTIISFIVFTKWWYGLVIDGKDVVFYGFPFIYKCEGFHTSLSTQYFLFEMLTNFLCYFIFWLIVVSVLIRKINIPKLISKVFWVGFGVLFLGFIYLSNDLDDRYLIMRDFDVKIFDSGFTLFESYQVDGEKYKTQ
ncbi:hypothetical protein [Pontimicrobium sp. IMCC45349]|uniref:hypothetical protein n=1 Tax=Pontimicrobium sp. IMCC45349 TaxID=3391574 RepID=UPI0039A03CE7